jgi:hypothetical protein
LSDGATAKYPILFSTQGKVQYAMLSDLLGAITFLAALLHRREFHIALLPHAQNK